MSSTSDSLTLTDPVQPDMPLRPEAQQILEQTFGFDAVRDGQAEVIERLLAGQSTLAIFPTGGGKSLCYQLPALLLDGLTIVISPLIALMKDQLDFLASKGIAAARLDSSLSRDEYLQVSRDLTSGRLRLLYVSPERFANERFLQTLGNLRIGLMAIDEAHCISQWGHNFRPDYLRIAKLAEQLAIPLRLALTATATPEVAADIAQALHIETDDVVSTGFYRSNLELHAQTCSDRQRKRKLVESLQEQPGPAVVYVTLQKTAEQIAAYLAAAKFHARAYHAGLGTEKRTEIQEEFMQSDDMIVVATIAFGMGIDKANIRGVYHYNLPHSLEGYMQEIGRAGRDGLPARCELLACADDITTLENFTYGDTPTPEAIANLTGEILAGGPEIELNLYDLSGRHDVRDLVVKTLLTYLELEGILQPLGAVYTDYQFKPLRDSRTMLARFDEARAQFVRDIFREARQQKVWFRLDVAAVATRLRQSRQRVIAALEYLDQQGDLVLQTASVRHRFRVLKQPADRTELVERLIECFVERETQDLARLAGVIDLVETPECLTQTLLQHFGEDREPCGHCDRCCGAPAQPLERTAAAIDDSDRAAAERLLRQNLPALAAPRQLARFLCGIQSPAASRAKLRQHDDFGRLSAVPFAEVLELAESI